MKKLLTAAICSSILFTGCQKPENNKGNTTPKKQVKTAQNNTTKTPAKKSTLVKSGAAKDVKKDVKKVDVKEPPFELPAVVAKVNGKEIKKDEIMKKIERLEKRFVQFKHKVSNKDRKKFAQNILQTMVRQQLIKTYIADKKITIDEKEVNKMFEKRKSFFKKPGDFENYLKRAGLTEAELKETLKDSLLTQKLFEDHVFKEIKVSDDAIKAHYEKNAQKYVQEEQVKASHILLKLPPKATDEQKAATMTKMKEILAAVKKGGDFAELAKKHSACPSGKRGGDLGFFGAKRMVKPFSQAAFALKNGEVSDVVETQFGYHIIKRTDHKPGKKLALTDEISSYRGKKLVKDQIKESLEQGEKRQKAKDFYEELKKQYKVELFI